MFSDDARLLISKRMGGEKNHRWKGDDIKPNGGRARANRLYTPDECWGCAKTQNLERHHVDENPKNNDAGNIKFLCQKCHKAFHFGQGVLTVFLDEIVSIECHEIEQTYDIEMENQEHNFVANGLVVHNSQESTRYCNYSKDKFENQITFMPALSGLTFEQRERRLVFYATCEKIYLQEIEEGVSPQIARDNLPICLKTELAMTCNLREWRHFFSLRTPKAAHPKLRSVTRPLLVKFRERFPVVFDDIGVVDEEGAV